MFFAVFHLFDTKTTVCIAYTGSMFVEMACLVKFSTHVFGPLLMHINVHASLQNH